jgi:hypothetical protein
MDHVRSRLTESINLAKITLNTLDDLEDLFAEQSFHFSIQPNRSVFSSSGNLSIQFYGEPKHRDAVVAALLNGAFNETHKAVGSYTFMEDLFGPDLVVHMAFTRAACVQYGPERAFLKLTQILQHHNDDIRTVVLVQEICRRMFLII